MTEEEQKKLGEIFEKSSLLNKKHEVLNALLGRTAQLSAKSRHELCQEQIAMQFAGEAVTLDCVTRMFDRMQELEDVSREAIERELVYGSVEYAEAVEELCKGATNGDEVAVQWQFRHEVLRQPGAVAKCVKILRFLECNGVLAHALPLHVTKTLLDSMKSGMAPGMRTTSLAAIRGLAAAEQALILIC